MSPSNSKTQRKSVRQMSCSLKCNYKFTDGEMWPTIPQESERFTTTNKFRKLDLTIFDTLLKTKNDVVMASQSSYNEPKNKKGLKKLKMGQCDSNVKKRKINAEVEDLSPHIEIVPGRKLKPPCGDNCRFQCSTKFTEAERQRIFEKFCAIGDIDKQRDYISSVIKTLTPKKKSVNVDATRSGSKIQAFYLQCTVNSEAMRVCKHYFMTTLDINIGMIKPKIRETGAVDRRTLYKGVLVDDLNQSVKDHINSIPKIKKYHHETQKTREYIERGKTLTQLYREYQKMCVTSNKRFVKESWYKRIFNTQFNIFFFPSKKDHCELCKSYEKKGNDNEDEDHGKTLFWSHLEEKHHSRKEMETDKKRSSIDLVCAVYDLQSDLTIPRGDDSVLYYNSKVANYNFTICEMLSTETFCYLWHEGEAQIGPNEISTCVFNFIKQKSEERDNDFEIIFYSDNCEGQSKNQNTIGLYQYALKKFPNIKSIVHKFLIRGHTLNECTTIHSIIEKQIKLSLKSSPIFTTKQYGQIIKNSKKKFPSFKVTELDYSQFYDFKKYTLKLGDNFDTNTDSESINFDDIKVLKMSCGQSGSFKYKTSYKDESFKTINFARKEKTRVSHKTIVEKLGKAYSKPCGIEPRKKKDLIKLCTQNHIPQSFHSFYANL